MELRTDEQLVAAYLGGEETALRELVGRYAKPVYSFVHGYVSEAGDAEDITQDAFVNAWKNLRKFDTEKKFKTWIFTIAKNASLNWLKRKKPELFSRIEAQEAFEQMLSDASPRPDEVFHQAGLKAQLALALGKLDPQSRTIVDLYSKDFTFDEIGKMTGEPLNTVKSRYRRALIALRDILGE